MADTSERINFGRAKLVIGFSLLAIGLFIGNWTWNIIESFQSGARLEIYPDYLYAIPASERFYYPSNYWVMRVPDYLLRYLTLGVFITTTSLTIVASSLLKQLSGIVWDADKNKYAKLIIGFVLITIGLIVSVEVWNTVPSFQGPITQVDNIDYVEGFPWGFLLPSSYVVLKVPDYLLRYLILGVFTTTVGLTILSFLVWKRLEMYSDSQQVRPVGETNDG